MPPQTPSPVPVDLEGKVKIGIRALVAVLISIVIGTATMVGLYYQLPNKDDLLNLFRSHNESKDSHPKMSETLENVQAQVKDVSGTLDAQQKEVGYIRARVDFLTEQAVRDKAPTRRAGDQAVKRLRSGEKPSDVVSE